MPHYHRMAELAPRDIVARAIDSELKKSGDDCVLLDVTHLDAVQLKERFPRISQQCLNYNIDITRDPIPVVPAAHYACGGVVTNLNGQTSIRGLYACGEVAHTGVHGANRLASNSLLEALVFAHQVYIHSIKYIKNFSVQFPEIPCWNDEGTFNHEEWVLISHDKAEIQELMWDYVGIVRSNLRLERARRRVELIANEIGQFYKKTKVTAALLELRNLASVAQLIITSALKRAESRGLHYTTDYPQRDDEKWQRDTIIISGKNNKYEFLNSYPDINW